jgi:hemerythrin superfamily protein
MNVSQDYDPAGTTAAVETLRATGQEWLQRGTRAVIPGATSIIRMDHTHVLALFRRFRPHTSLARRQALVTNACLALEIHAQLEEEIFYPALREAVGTNEVLDKSVPEHDEMRKSITTLRGLSPTDARYEEAFHELIREVLHHVADEETVLLPLAEHVLSDRLGELGMRMNRRRVQLMKPRLNELAVTTAQSFPVLVGAAAVGVMLLGWLAVRPSPRDRSEL